MVMPGNITSVAFDLEASLPKSVLDKCWRQAHRVRIVEDAAQQVPGSERRLLIGVVHHEVVYETSPPGESASKARRAKTSMSPPPTAPQTYDIEPRLFGRPLRGDGVASQVRDPIGQSGPPRISLGRLDGLWKIENGRFQLRVCAQNASV